MEEHRLTEEDKYELAERGFLFTVRILKKDNLLREMSESNPWTESEIARACYQWLEKYRDSDEFNLEKVIVSYVGHTLHSYLSDMN